MKNRDWAEWWKRAGVRAAKTAAQVALSMLTVGQAFIDINWLNVISVTAVAAGMSVLTSIAGLPEVGSKGTDLNSEKESEEK